MNRIRGFLSKVSKGFAFFRKTLTNRAVRENAILLLTAPLFPKLHIRLRVKYGHYIPENPIDLSHPKLFNEKLLWLQYYIYNKSPVVQQCYDKYRVRDFVRQQGCEYTLNPIYGVWDDMDDIPWDSLPAQCAIKATSGWSNHVFRTHGEPVDPEQAKERLRRWEKQRITFRQEGILFAAKENQHYICEHLMTADGGGFPSDYKFYCFHGEPRYVLWISDRFSGETPIEVYKDVDWNDRQDICNEFRYAEAPKPSCYDEMLDIARKLSAPFPFVRVDLYDIGGKPVFGELTFAPGGEHSAAAQKEMGELLHMERMKEYRKKLLSHG